MRIRLTLIFIFIIIALMTGCASRHEPQTARQEKYVQLGNEQVTSVGKTRVVSMTTMLRPGDTGKITIQGNPGARYGITATYKVRGNTVRAFEWKNSDTNGKVTWTWKVRTDTDPGTYPIAISGGGRFIKASYTIVR